MLRKNLSTLILFYYHHIQYLNPLSRSVKPSSYLHPSMKTFLGELEKKSASIFRLGAYWYTSDFFIEDNEKLLTYTKPNGKLSKIRLGECRIEILKPQNADGKLFPILIQSIKDQGDQWILNAQDSTSRESVINQLSQYCVDTNDPQAIMDFINEVEYNTTDP